jgi:hypothetical protein
LYLTVKQVRVAACAWVKARGLGPTARKVIYQRAVDLISYHQHRNQQARVSNTKTAVKRLRKLGIEVGHLPPCKPDDL